jgi:hypothetical protein
MNMMNIKYSIAIAVLSLGMSIPASGQIVSLAYEVPLSEFRAPATTNGGASFRECSECERHLVRVTAATNYVINGESMQLKAFKEALLHANDRDEKTLTVLHHLESDTIQSISVSL